MNALRRLYERLVKADRERLLDGTLLAAVLVQSVRDRMRDTELWVRLADVRVPNNGLMTGLVAARLGQILRTRAAERTSRALGEELAQLRAVEAERLSHEARRVEQGDERAAQVQELQKGLDRLAEAAGERDQHVVEMQARVDGLTVAAGRRDKQLMALAFLIAAVAAGVVAVAIWRH